MSTQTAQCEPGPSEDVALVHSAKEGSIAAFEELMSHHTAAIFRLAMHITNSTEDAEDVVQDTFLKAFQHLEHFEERARFSTWLTRIAVNEALGRLRRSRRAPTMSLDADTDEHDPMVDRVADWRPNPEQAYSTAELRSMLKQALAALPEMYRIVFLLRDLEGLSTAETAELLGLCISSVKARLLRARLRLRQHLSPHFESGRTPARTAEPLNKIFSESSHGLAG